MIILNLLPPKPFTATHGETKFECGGGDMRNGLFFYITHEREGHLAFQMEPEIVEDFIKWIAETVIGKEANVKTKL